MPAPLETFVSQLVDSQLLAMEEVRALLDSSPAERRPQDAEQLARELVRQKKLTAYQAKTIYQGKGKTLVLGNYRVLDKLGQGGMGIVLKAEHRRMERIVALKLLSPQIVKEPGALQRFLREVKAAARLNHPNVVTAHDSDEVRGTHFLVMEYVDGQDLASLVQQQGRLPVEKALNCVLQAARGLDYAHRQGVIHRDIKPSNLLLSRDGTVKVLDMGLARLEYEQFAETDLTHSGQMMGTIDFMSPEQAVSTKGVDARSDIYSLGCTLYYLITARHMYEGQTKMGKLLAHRDGPIPSLVEQASRLSDSGIDIGHVDALFQRMVAKQVADRQSSMAVVITEIEECLSQSAAGPKLKTASAEDQKLEEFLRYVAERPPARRGAPPALGKPNAALALGVFAEPSSEDPALAQTVTHASPIEDTNARLSNDKALPQSSHAKRNLATKTRGFGVLAACLVGLLVTGLAVAGVLLRVNTPAGTIVVEVDQPEAIGAEILVDGEHRITIQAGASQEPITIAADEKQHTLKVEKGGFETFTRQFTIRAGQERAIRVGLEPLKAASSLSKSGDATTSTANASPESRGVSAKEDIGPRPLPIDVLSLVDPSQDAVRGRWWREKTDIVGLNDKGGAVIEIPYQPPAEYDFTVELTRNSIANQSSLALSHAGRQFKWVLGFGDRADFFGFDVINGRGVQDIPEDRHPELALIVGRRYTTKVEIRRNRLTGYLDGAKVAEEKTDYSNLSTWLEVSLRRDDLVGLIVAFGTCTFHRAEVQEVSGRGTFLRSEN